VKKLIQQRILVLKWRYDAGGQNLACILVRTSKAHQVSSKFGIYWSHCQFRKQSFSLMLAALMVYGGHTAIHIIEVLLKQSRLFH